MADRFLVLFTLALHVASDIGLLVRGQISLMTDPQHDPPDVVGRMVLSERRRRGIGDPVGDDE